MTDTIPSTAKVPLFMGNKEIVFVEKAVPKPGTGQLLLRVRANALCGSERPQFYDGTSVTPGHEAAGTVVAAGPGTIIAPERSIVGSEYFRYDELPANLRRLQRHRAYLTQIITHRYGVDEIQQAFEAFFFGCETGKVVIEQ